uniref:Uncharacterized protein n=1 Tax=Cacopsylla melanoneura TaxID=428564 RepID=A0A8D8UNA4_9HEMI
MKGSMTDLNKFVFVCSSVFITMLLMSLGPLLVGADGNYPETGIKKCTQKKSTVDFIGPLCIPFGQDGGWTKESEENCKSSFKSTCPEFNEAECLWYPWKPSDRSLNVNELQLPCCRLKYYASRVLSKKYTWMEILYTNQYGTNLNNTVYDVVEIHRLIKNHEVFGDNDQPDWPGNVLDPKGERGLPWVELKNNSKPLDLLGSKICPNNKDEQQTCAKKVVEYLRNNFQSGFDPKLPVLSDYLKGRLVNSTYHYTPSCSVAMIGGLKTNVCSVQYYNDVEYKSYVSGTNNLTDRYLEAQVYTNPKGGEAVIRYAYIHTYIS